MVNARGAEERFRELLEQKDAAVSERTQLTETLAVLQAEHRGETELWAQKEAALVAKIGSLETPSSLRSVRA